MTEQLRLELEAPTMAQGVTLAQLSAAWQMRAILDGLSREDTGFGMIFSAMTTRQMEAAHRLRQAYRPTGARSMAADLVWPWPFREGWRREDGRAWGWACPGCGGEIVSSIGERRTPAQIAQDARCSRCRGR